MVFRPKRLNKTHRTIVDVLAHHGPMTRPDIVKKLNEIRFDGYAYWIPVDFQTHFSLLERQGIIQKVIGSRKGNTYLYEVVKR